MSELIAWTSNAYSSRQLHPLLVTAIFTVVLLDALVGDAMLNELDHPRFVQVIEEALDVGIKHEFTFFFTSA
jgi:hypothetical protein